MAARFCTSPSSGARCRDPFDGFREAPICKELTEFLSCFFLAGGGGGSHFLFFSGVTVLGFERNASLKMAELTSAYDTLMDPKRRAALDQATAGASAGAGGYTGGFPNFENDAAQSEWGVRGNALTSPPCVGPLEGTACVHLSIPANL